MTTSGRLPIASVRKRSLMRSDESQIPPAPGMARVGRIRMTPGEPTAPGGRARPPTPDAVGRLGPRLRSTTRACGSRSGRVVLVAPRGAWSRSGDPAPHARARAQGRASSPRGRSPRSAFEGNATIPPEKIKAKLLSKVGQPFDPQKIDADLKSLMGTNWFSEVEAYLRRVAAQERQVRPDLRRPRDARPDPRRVPGAEGRSASRRSRTPPA